MTEQLNGQLDLIEGARSERDEKIAQAEANATRQDIAVIDQAIEVHAQLGKPFSANDLRPLLPPVRTPVIGGRFAAARKRGLIKPIGTVTSSDRGTHAKPVALWIGTGQETQ